MTSQEPTSAEHAPALNRVPSSSSVDGDENKDGDGDRNKDGNGEEVEVRDGEVAEAEVEEVGVGVAVTTAEDDEPVGVVVVLDDEHDPRLHSHSHPGLHPHPYPAGDRAHVGASAASVSFMSVARHASSSSSFSMRRVASPPLFASRSQSAMGSVSASVSNSHSRSRSQSQSHSSLKLALEMGESSSATSWTHADVEGLGGERPSGDDERLRLGDKAHCRLDVEPVPKETGEKERVVVSRTETLSRLGANRSSETMGAGADGDASRKEVILVAQEEDIAEGWHPSRHRGKAPLQDDVQDDGENEKGLEEEDVGSVHALESLHGGDRSSETNEKERWQSLGSTGSNSRRLRLEFEQPSSQSWDDADPPTDRNDMGTSDYYSTLNSKKFEAMQKSRRRPLIPHSSYYFGPPPPDSAYGTHPVGQIGVHHPREIVRIERDYVGGELIQFSPVFPLELEGRITPTQFHQTINDINEILISAHSIQHTLVDNILAVLTLQLSSLVLTSHYTKEMRRLKRKIEEFNTQLYDPVGLHILWPQKVAFLFLEIEYY